MEGKGKARSGGRHRPPRHLNDDRLCYTIPEVAEKLGISRNFGYELARRREIPIIKFGKRLLVPKAAFERMLEQNRNQG